jgi:hypothetical protein
MSGTMGGNEIPKAGLTSAEFRDLRRLAGIMVPADQEYGVPGADDELILADIVRSLGRDSEAVRAAIAMLREIAGAGFCDLDAASAESSAMTLLGRNDAVVTALGRAVLQCYYRDDRVMKSLGVEPVAPFPRGRSLPQTDWSLLDAVRGRPPLWRDDRKRGA